MEIYTYMIQTIFILQKLLKNSRSWRHFRSKICTYSMYEIYSPSSSPFVLFQNVRQTIETSRRIRRREDRIHSIFYSMSTTNDGFECYSRGGFAKFEHESLERGMREAIVVRFRGKMSTLPEVRVSPFILTFIFQPRTLFTPQKRNLSIQGILPTSFLPFV